MIGTPSDEAVAAPAPAQAVVETVTPGQDTESEQPIPASKALVAGDVALQAVGEAGAGDMMPTSSESAGVAQQPGEAPRVQKSRGLHDLLDRIRVNDGEKEQGEVVSETLAAAPGSSGGGNESGSGSGSENGGGAQHQVGVRDSNACCVWNLTFGKKYGDGCCC